MKFLPADSSHCQLTFHSSLKRRLKNHINLSHAEQNKYTQTHKTHNPSLMIIEIKKKLKPRETYRWDNINTIFVLRKKGSKTKEIMKGEEIEKGDCGPPTRKVFFWLCRTWTKRYLITSQTRVTRVSRIHHRTVLRTVRWCIRLTSHTH